MFATPVASRTLKGSSNGTERAFRHSPYRNVRGEAGIAVHHLTQVLAPDCTPLFLTDGFKEYATALQTHYGYWVQPERRQARGPALKPRWMPLPGLLYAQV